MVTTRKDSKDFWKMVEKLEETSIETWKFRNEKLHAQNEKQATEIQELRVDNKKLAKQVDDLLKKIEHYRLLEEMTP
jgi:cell division protein FtsB|tara:strand:+ start:204 stop:434 length:231 start_codon:yes stop_codon:yes gene_type:complete